MRPDNRLISISDENDLNGFKVLDLNKVADVMGLVYKHMPFGALPLGYDEIIYLPTVSMRTWLLSLTILFHTSL